MLTAGAQEPVIPLLEVGGKTGAGSPEQIGAKAENVGTIVAGAATISTDLGAEIQPVIMSFTLIS